MTFDNPFIRCWLRNRYLGPGAPTYSGFSFDLTIVDGYMYVCPIGSFRSRFKLDLAMINPHPSPSPSPSIAVKMDLTKSFIPHRSMNECGIDQFSHHLITGFSKILGTRTEPRDKAIVLQRRESSMNW